MLTHPTHDRLSRSGSPAWRRHSTNSNDSPTSQRSPSKSGSLCSSTAKPSSARTRRLVSRLKFASLRQTAVVEDIDMKAPRGLDKALFQKLVAGEWIDTVPEPAHHRPDRAGDMIQYLPTLLIFQDSLPRVG